MQATSDRSRAISLAAPLFVALGLAVVLLATPRGLGFGHDSIFYWSGAVNLLAGKGISRPDATGAAIPITHFPPLYPAVLALGSSLSGLDVQQVARGLAAVLLGANMAMIWLLVRRSTGSAIAAGLAGLLVLSAPTLLEPHLWAMSEPLYLGLLLVTFVLLTGAITRPRVLWLVAAAGGFAGLAYLTRYAGLALIASGALVLLIFGPLAARERLRRATLFSAIGLAPGVAWQVRNALLTGSPSNRVLGWHPPTADQLKAAGATLASWLPIETVPLMLRAGLVGVLIVYAAFRMWRANGNSDGGGALLALSVAHGALYIGFLLVSLTLFDASTRLSPRILAPLFLAGLLSAALLAWRLYVRSGSSIVGLSLIAAPVALILLQARASSDMLAESAASGLGFSSTGWRNSETAQAAAQLDPDLALYSNQALPLYFMTGRPAAAVPEVTDPVKGEIREDYPELLAGMRSRLQAGEAALVLFHPESLGPELPDLATLTLGLRPVLVAEDGAIYLTEDQADG